MSSHPSTDTLPAPVVSEEMQELVDSLEESAYNHGMEWDDSDPPQRKVMRQLAEESKETLLRAIKRLEQDKALIDGLDAVAKRSGIIVTAGDNSFSLVEGSARSAIESFVAEFSPPLSQTTR